MKRNVNIIKCVVYILNKSSAVAEMVDRLATTDMSRKVGAIVHLSLGVAWSPSNTNTTSPGPRPIPPYQVASLSIQPFGHNTPTLQTGRQDRQDNGPVAYGEPLLVTVAQKNNCDPGRGLRLNSITLSWSQTGPKLVADLQGARNWPII